MVRNLSRFFKALIVVLVVVTILLLLGRDHFVLGTGLIMFRWILVGLFLILLYLTYRRITPIGYRAVLIAALFTLFVEYGWNRLTEKSLSGATFETEVSVMTYNVFFRNSIPARSLKVIENFAPDILLVQELTPAWKEELDKAFAGRYPYTRIKATEGTHGIGIYSKYPILRSEVLNNSSGRPFAQVLELKIGSKKVQLINAHLASPAVAVEDPDNFMHHYRSNYDVRYEQLQEINRVASAKAHAFDAQMVVGDLNTTTFEPIYRDFKKSWVNLYEEAGQGSGFSFPNTSKMAPILSLDYIFGRGLLEGIEVSVIGGGSSDHLAVGGKIRI